MCSLFKNKNFIRSVFLPPLPSPPFAETENTTNGTNLDEGASSLCVCVCVRVIVCACAGKCVCVRVNQNRPPCIAFEQHLSL